MLLGNYFNENRMRNVDCSVLVFPEMEKENLSNKDRKKKSVFIFFAGRIPNYLSFIAKIG